jgi:hypothetical protein
MRRVQSCSIPFSPGSLLHQQDRCVAVTIALPLSGEQVTVHVIERPVRLIAAT